MNKPHSDDVWMKVTTTKRGTCSQQLLLLMSFTVEFKNATPTILSSLTTAVDVNVPLYWLSHTHTQTHPFNGPFFGTTQVSRYQKGKTNLDFTEARDSECQRQWHQLEHMQVCTSLQKGNHVSTPPLSFYRPDALPAAQPTVSKH